MSLAMDPKLSSALVNLEKARENSALHGAGKAGEDADKIKKLSQDFEAIFVGIMLKSMREAVPKSGFLDGGNAESLYRSMLDSEYARMMSEQQDTGLAKNIENFLLQAANIKPVETPTQSAEKVVSKTKGMAAYQTAQPMVSRATMPEVQSSTPAETRAEKRLDAIISRLDTVTKE